MPKPKIRSDGSIIMVRVPISIRRRGGRKIVLAPDGIEHDPGKLRCQQIDNAMVKALARAFRWREILERGECSTIKEIAALERINESYIARILRLTLLAPDIVEAIVDGRQSPAIALPILMKRLKPAWSEQRAIFRLIR
jgi:hypothetical protein